MDALNFIYQSKDGFVPPDHYLCSNFEKVQLEDGRTVSYTNCIDYLKSATGEVNNSLGKDKTELNHY